MLSRPFWSSIRLLLVVALVVTGSACRRRPQYLVGQQLPGGEVVTFAPSPTTVIVTGSEGEAELRAALARALESRRFALESSEPTRLVARLSARSVSVRVAIDLAPQQIVISYLDSNGLEVDEARQSRRYDGWIRSLADTIEAEIARPERERQEAIARAEAAEHQRERETRDADERSRERDRQERIERDRLATARAQAEADAARSHAAAAEAQARPRVQVGTYASVDRLGFDATRARRRRGVVRVDAGFGDAPRVGRGRAGGPESAPSMGFPDACPGWFDRNPQHTVVLTSDLPYLRVEAPSDGDATLAIVTPDGSVWCDDDSAGNLTPRLEGWFPAGVYQVYVGSYARGVASRYQLLFSEHAAVVAAQAQATQAAPSCRQALLAMGHAPAHLMFCDRAEPYCAESLLRAGHAPAHLTFCEGVEPTCAVALLQRGNAPAGLIHCR